MRAYAAAANLLTSVLGVYFALFVSLPVTIKVYEFFTKDKGETKKRDFLADDGAEAQAAASAEAETVKA